MPTLHFSPRTALIRSVLLSLAFCLAFCIVALVPAHAQMPVPGQNTAQTQVTAPASPLNPKFDAELAKQTGADENGMKPYVLVILKSGPNKVPAGPERDEMFKGHFANMKRLAAEGKLAFAGPLDGVDGWRGLFVMVTADIAEAQKFTATDPVIIKGEMIAEYHRLYGSAALMLVNEAHGKLSAKNP